MSVKHGFIGFGNLAKAVYQGLKQEENIEFAYFARSRKEADIPYYNKISDLVAFADVIWLMVKPQDLSAVLEELTPLDRSGKTIVSPVAGRNIAFIERYLGTEQLIVRIMPNLAMAYRKSVTAFVSNQPDNGNASEIFHLLEKLGKAVQLEENGLTCSQPSLAVVPLLSSPLFKFSRIKCRNSISRDHFSTNSCWNLRREPPSISPKIKKTTA